MVLPVGGLTATGAGPPPEQVLRLLPVLKVCLVGVTIVIIGEFIATYFNEAISELLTPLMGIIALRDVTQTGQCILCLGLVSCFNCLSDITSLVLILLGQRYIPGAKYFFSTVCYGDVRVYDPTTRSTKVVNKELCSWETVLGNVVLVLGVILEFAVCRLSLKIFRAYQMESANGLNGLMGMEGAQEPDLSQGMAPDAVPANPRPANPGSAQRQGFVPFSGAGQRLN
ncbi:unnamed protein product [Effrenium voratum]|nr:unnamed protein product [Effrenium voratum]